MTPSPREGRPTGHRSTRSGPSGGPPVRTCVGCRQAAAQEELIRFAAVEGRIVPDLDRRRPGRGAWLHPQRACLERALARRGFDRAMKGRVHAGPDLIDWMDEWQRSASTS